MEHDEQDSEEEQAFEAGVAEARPPRTFDELDLNLVERDVVAEIAEPD
jgi:hypothetical protein